MNGIFSCAQKKIRDRSLLKLTKTRESCAPHEHARGRRPATLARGSRGVSRTLYQCAGTRSRTGPAIPTVKRKLCGRKGPEVFQPRGGVFRESPVRSTWKLYCWRCAKTVVGVCGWAQNAKSICIYLTTKPVAIPSESFATLGSKRTVSNSTTTLRAALN